MHFNLLDNLLWALSFAGNVVLLVVLLMKERWKQFPVFTFLIADFVAETIALFLIYSYGSFRWYTIIYWATFLLDFLLQIALLFEIARIVLRPTGTWLRDARSSFLLWAASGAIAALALSYAVRPPAQSWLAALEVRAILFTSLLFCELFFAMMLAAQRLGLVWRSHVMRLGQGLTAWSLATMLVNTAHSYLGTTNKQLFNTLEHVRILVYIFVTAYWAVTFWSPEPERRPLSPQMLQYLVALHEKVQYDASQVRGAQNPH
ncbi:hypothetical protein [Pseudacidobacterium ailaaui]|jgi:hypothetical protein|uniref:hypothetical protein n=1 Tax=Pseudacidobacterium ailaaui TaxID=1382359 RepID=UPI00047C6A6F|nr:hypothetical protein [Pseudacidobacterium ailaaui]MDI3255305.1 hypothetical protein [Bacillota bacterium]